MFPQLPTPTHTALPAAVTTQFVTPCECECKRCGARPPLPGHAAHAAQAWQVLAPASLVNPPEHGTHADAAAAGAWDPGGQGTHSDAARDTEKNPAVHSVHALVAPTELLALPGAHDVHVTAPATDA